MKAAFRLAGWLNPKPGFGGQRQSSCSESLHRPRNLDMGHHWRKYRAVVGALCCCGLAAAIAAVSLTLFSPAVVAQGVAAAQDNNTKGADELRPYIDEQVGGLQKFTGPQRNEEMQLPQTVDGTV